MPWRGMNRKRKAEGDPPTSHFEASLLNQRNPEGSVSNRPQLNDPDAPPPPQRPRGSLRSSETAPLPQNQRGLQDANLTSPPPRNLSLLDLIPQNTATTSSSSQNSIPPPVNPTVTNAPSSSQSTPWHVVTPWQRVERLTRDSDGNQVVTQTFIIRPPSPSSYALASRVIATSLQPHRILPPPPSTSGTVEPPTCVVCGAIGSSRRKLTRFPGGNVCEKCINFHKETNDTGREFVCKSGPHRLPHICYYCKYQRCLAAGLRPRDVDDRWWDVGLTRRSQRASTRLPTPQPLQTPSSSQPIPQIVIRRPSDDRLGTLTVDIPLASPSLSPLTSSPSPRDNPDCPLCGTRKAKSEIGKGYPCQRCGYRSCLEVGMKARTPKGSSSGTPSTSSPRSTGSQSSGTVHKPQSPDLILPSFLQEATLRQFVEQLQTAQGGNRLPGEAQTADVLQPLPPRTVLASEAIGLLSPFGSPQERQSTGSFLPLPPFSYSETSAFSPICAVCGDRCRVLTKYHGRHVCRACILFHQRTIENKTIWSCSMGDYQCHVGYCNGCKYMRCLAVGLPPVDTNVSNTPKPNSPSVSDLLSAIVLWAKPILRQAGLTEPQMRQIFDTQWPMLLVLANFEKPEAHEFHKPFESDFQECKVTKQEYEHLKKIALFLKPREPYEFTFEEQLEKQYEAFSIFCGNPARFAILLRLLSKIEYLNPIDI